MKKRSVSILCLKILLGQALAFIVSTTGMFTTLLIEKFSFQIPIVQCLGAYTLLLMCTAPLYFAYKGRERSDASMCTYAFLAFCDANANILIVYAYQFSDMPTIQLLMCFSIPSVMLLSTLAYRYEMYQGSSIKTTENNTTHNSPAKAPTRPLYSRTQYLSACVCLAGIISLIITDAVQSRESLLQIDKARIFGDALSIFGVILYAVSNVGCELLIKRKSPVDAGERETALNEVVSRSHEEDGFQGPENIKQKTQYILEYLLMLGLFGSISCIIELVLFEGALRLCATQSVQDQYSLSGFDWGSAASPTFIAYLFSFCATMVIIYFIIPALLILSSATFLNLSLLATQFYVLMWASLFFAYKIQVFFAVSFALTMLGAVIYECDFR